MENDGRTNDEALNPAFSRPKGLEKENTYCLKGILAVFILIHHLYQYSGLFRDSIIGAGLQALGVFVVACFFFLSGYGLLASYEKKGVSYVKRLPLARILPFYLIIVFLTLAYMTERLLLGESFSASDYIKSFLFGGGIVVNGWYLQVQLLLYLVFFLAFLIPNKKWAIAITGVSVLAYMVVACVCGLSWATVPAFFLGMIYCVLKDKIATFLSSWFRWGMTFPLLLAASLGCYAMMRVFTNEILDTLCMTFSSCFFALFMASFVHKVPLCCGFTKVLGMVSFEVYVLQGFFLIGFRGCITNPYLYVLVVTLCTYALAFALHPLFHWVYAVFKRIPGKVRDA